MKAKSILIVEDEATIALDIEMRLMRLGFHVCGMVHKPHLVMKEVSENDPEVILMDINLKGKEEGIGLAEEVLKTHNIPVVFLTAYTDRKTFEKANESGSFGFLTKPFKDVDLRNAIDMALKQAKELQTVRTSISELKKKIYELDHGGGSIDTIFLKDGSGYVNVKLDQVLYIKADDVYSRVVLTDSELLVNSLLGDLSDRLPSSRFIRIHRSYIVSISHIHKITSDDVIIGGIELPVSKSYKKTLHERIH